MFWPITNGSTNILENTITAPEKANIIAARICAALLPLIDGEVEGYRTDIDHDVTAIERATTEYGNAASYIHVSRKNGTNIFIHPHTVASNELEKYLFGHKRPLDILGDYAGVLSDCLEDAVSFRAWEGKSWKALTRDEAVALSRELTRKARVSYAKRLNTGT